MAKVSRRRLARAIVPMLAESTEPAARAKVIQQIAAYLIQHKQVSRLRLLANDIADEARLQQQHVSADVVTAFPLTTDTRMEVVELLKKATGAQTTAFTEIIDPSLLGGIIVRTTQLELDASVKRQLNQLAGGTN
jgi:F-type H+-transporting ATPase subunit delta